MVDALQNGIHIARVAQVVQAHRALCGGYAPERLAHKPRSVNVVKGFHYLHGLASRFHGIVESGWGGPLPVDRLLVGVDLAYLLAVQIHPSSVWRLSLWYFVL